MDIASSNKAMWRGALIPALIACACSVLGSFLWTGIPGLVGGTLASFIVLIFFSVSLLVSALTKSADPITTFSLAIFSYFTKLVLVACLLIAVTRLTDESTVNRQSFGISALIISAAWLGGEIRAFLRLRLELEIPLGGSGTISERKSEEGDRP